MQDAAALVNEIANIIVERTAPLKKRVSELEEERDGLRKKLVAQAEALDAYQGRDLELLARQDDVVAGATRDARTARDGAVEAAEQTAQKVEKAAGFAIRAEQSASETARDAREAREAREGSVKALAEIRKLMGKASEEV